MDKPFNSSADPGFSPKRKSVGLKSFFWGGLLPIIAFTVIEDQYGTVAGIIAGLIFGLGEVIYELWTDRRVSKVTLVGNGMLFLLGALSLAASDGIWFKLQPAIFEFFFAVMLWGSLLLKKNILLIIAEKQGQVFPEPLKQKMNGLSFRLAIFFLLQSVLATWAAFYWSTQNWALLKGVGLTASMILWMGAEVLLLRRSLRK